MGIELIFKQNKQNKLGITLLDNTFEFVILEVLNPPLSRFAGTAVFIYE